LACQKSQAKLGLENLKGIRRQIMARIAHIALLTKDTEKLAEFYKTSFGMKEVARSGEGGEHGRAIYVSDGHINLAILPARNRREGIYHFGIAVDDVKGAVETALAAGATGGTAELPKDGRFAETFVLDPVGTRVDLSPGWKV
jgi:catechol 2,3-dioxygenase-like lactoylglutathione lyase family enzyme